MMEFLQNLGSWQRVVEGRGIEISVIGMLIVYVALVIISLSVAGVPHVLTIVNRFVPEPNANPAPTKAASEGTGDDVVAAIGLALHHSRLAE